ncbi:MAG: hypothetical protein WC763_07560 [Candidatus Paceibacterota bacterium]|jgi:hypothetical protein
MTESSDIKKYADDAPGHLSLWRDLFADTWKYAKSRYKTLRTYRAMKGVEINLSIERPSPVHISIGQLGEDYFAKVGDHDYFPIHLDKPILS